MMNETTTSCRAPSAAFDFEEVLDPAIFRVPGDTMRWALLGPLLLLGSTIAAWSCSPSPKPSDASGVRLEEDGPRQRFENSFNVFFAYLADRELSGDFREWLVENQRLEEMESTLDEWIRSSEKIEDPERALWNNLRKVMNDDDKARLLVTLGDDAAKRATRPGYTEFLEARDLHLNGEHEAAESRYLESIRLDPFANERFERLAELYGELGEVSKELAIRERAAGAALTEQYQRLDEETLRRSVAALNRAAARRRARGELDEATAANRRALSFMALLYQQQPSLENSRQLALTYSAIAAVEQRRGHEAAYREYLLKERELLKTLAEQEDAWSLNNLAWSTATKTYLREQIGLGEALGYARRAVQLEPEDPDNLDTLATVYCFRGEGERALEVYEKVLKLSDRKDLARRGEWIRACAAGTLDPFAWNWDDVDTEAEPAG